VGRHGAGRQWVAAQRSAGGPAGHVACSPPRPTAGCRRGLGAPLRAGTGAHHRPGRARAPAGRCGARCGEPVRPASNCLQPAVTLRCQLP
jgi:hypothetical protein